jgi:hypothetical protein
MNRTTIEFTDDEKERLARLAQREGRSESDIIREALHIYEETYRPYPEPVSEGFVSVPELSAADIPEEELLRGFGEQRPSFSIRVPTLH